MILHMMDIDICYLSYVLMVLCRCTVYALTDDVIIIIIIMKNTYTPAHLSNLIITCQQHSAYNPTDAGQELQNGGKCGLNDWL